MRVTRVGSCTLHGSVLSKTFAIFRCPAYFTHFEALFLSIYTPCPRLWALAVSTSTWTRPRAASSFPNLTCSPLPSCTGAPTAPRNGAFPRFAPGEKSLLNAGRNVQGCSAKCVTLRIGRFQGRPRSIDILEFVSNCMSKEVTQINDLNYKNFLADNEGLVSQCAARQSALHAQNHLRYFP
jgi:hypothetical protein